ncbi:MAG: hypothetical protein ACXVRE_05720 [Gaiellaceae bacterium]
MRPVFKVLLRWALSPVGTLLNTGMLATLLLVRGVDPGSVLFWLSLVIFFGAAAAYDINAYVVQRRKGLTSAQVSDAVFERLWGSPPEQEEQEEA